MHMSGQGLTAASFQKFTQEHVMTLFGIDAQEEVESGLPGVTMTKPVRNRRTRTLREREEGGMRTRGGGGV
jgi:hypothetical protein